MTGFCFCSYRFGKGFTLVELMVAMVLGAFFLNGVLQIFFSAKQAYRTQENLARLQENGRLALDFISQDVRMAGYWGCSHAAPSTDGFNNLNFFYKFGTALEGFEALSETAWTPELDSSFDQTGNDKVLGGSDVLTVRRANALGFLVAKHGDAANPLELQLNVTEDDLTEADIKTGSVAIAANCTQAEAFQVTSISPGSPITIEHKAIGATIATPGNKTGNLLIPYENAKVHAVNTISYYVAINRNNEKLLYRRIGSTVKAEELALVDGVEKMQILYGVDTDVDGASGKGAPNYYVKADDVDNWDNVVSVRVSLLVATLDNVADRPVPYIFNNDPHDTETKTIPPESDKKIRRVFTSTIAVRNRLK
jgi:type IV pilus assembly protein PilW